MERKFEDCITCPEILYEKYGKGEDKCAECIVESKESIMEKEYAEPFVTRHGFEEDKIEFLDKDGNVCYENYPLEIIETAVAWVIWAEENNWKYLDRFGSTVSKNQLGRYIEELQKVRDKQKGI